MFAAVSSKKFLTLIGGYLLILLLLLLPVLAARHPPLLDYHNHLARMHIQSAIDTDEGLNSIYRLQHEPIPNLATDMLSVPLMAIFEPYTAGRVLIGIMLAVWLAAPAVLYRTLWGRWSLWPGFAALLFYNANLTYGFLNFYFASALSLLAFAGWIGSSKWNHWRRLLVFLPVATALYFGHILAVALYGLLVAAYEIGQGLNDGERRPVAVLKRLLLVGAQFVPALILFSSVRPDHGGLDTFWAPPLLSAIRRVYSCFMSCNLSTDLVTLLVFLVVIASVLCLRNSRRVHPAMPPSLFALLIIVLILPKELLGIFGVSGRYPFVLGALTIAAVRIDWKSLAVKRAVAMLFLVTLAFRGVAISADWRAFDAEAEELIAAFGQIEDHSRLLPAFPDSEAAGEADWRVTRHWHSASYAVIESGAFLPSMFSVGRLTVTEPYEKWDRPNLQAYINPALNGEIRVKTGREAWETLPDGWIDFYDYLLVYFPSAEIEAVLDHSLTPVFEGSFFTLYGTGRGD